MVLDKLGDALQSTIDKIRGSTVVDEKLVKELVKDLQRALLRADVDVELVSDITDTIQERALERDAPGAISRQEHIVKIVYEELVAFVGEEEELDLSHDSNKIMLVGLFGAGKTTTAGKLAHYYHQRNDEVAVVQTDTWRPAAYDQLEQLAEEAGVDFYGDETADDPVAVWRQYEEQLEQYDLVIADTAGRDALNDELVEELDRLDDAVDAHEKLLVMPADIGQSAERQAEQFRETSGVTGVVITKMDGTAKGGGALTACAAAAAPVKFIGVGEKQRDLERFRPEGFIGRLLGRGDIEALLERAEQAIDEEQAEDLGKRFLKGEFNLVDLYEQMEAMQQMGSLGKIMEMVPGFSQLEMPEEALDVQEEKMADWRVLMDSMTQEELEDPDCIDASRIDRIAAGAGLEPKDVRSLLKQYRQAKKMSKMFKGGGGQMEEMMERMQQGNMPGGMGDMFK